MSDTSKLNLRQKLIKIYDMLDHIEKAGFNKNQNYHFVRSADMLRAMRAAFAELGVYAETNFELLGTYDITTTKGGVMHTATVRASIVLFDCDSDETKTISGLGDGADSGDKGIYKAQTGAVKNALRNGALLPDEADSDPEADERVDRNVGEMPDFQEAKHAAPKAPEAQSAAAKSATAKTGPSQPAQSTETPQSSGALSVDAPSTPAETVQDAGPESIGTDLRLPTEDELKSYRSAFQKLGDDLTADGKLTASRSLPTNRKLLVFLLSFTKATDATKITNSQWIDFFERVSKIKKSPAGLVGLTTLVNKANGIEEKPKK